MTGSQNTAAHAQHNCHTEKSVPVTIGLLPGGQTLLLRSLQSTQEPCNKSQG